MTKNKKLLIAGISVVSLAVISGVIYGMIPKEMPDPEKMTQKEALDYTLSDDFAKLPIEKKKEYMRKRMENRKPGDRGNFRNLTKEQRKKLGENMRPVFRAMMKERMDKYFTLSKEEKVAYLDKMIDEGDARRKKWAEERAKRGNSAGPPPPPKEEGTKDSGDKNNKDKGRRRHSPQRMKKHIESTTPEERAKFTEFMRDMRERRKQRSGK